MPFLPPPFVFCIPVAKFVMSYCTFNLLLVDPFPLAYTYSTISYITEEITNYIFTGKGQWVIGVQNANLYNNLLRTFHKTAQYVIKFETLACIIYIRITIIFRISNGPAILAKYIICDFLWTIENRGILIMRKEKFVSKRLKVQ